MKSLILPIFFTFLIAGVSAQNPNWGWALPITVDQSGSSITCSVYDPVQSQTKTTSASSVNDLIYNQGIVAWTTSTSTHALIYDYNSHSWKEDYWSGTDNLTNEDGVVAWQSSTSTYAAIYDPVLQTWKYDYWSGTDNLNNDQGVVAWQSTTSTYAAVYDPTLHAWKYDYWSGTDNLLLQDGIMAWQSSTSTYAAVYDPALKTWKYDYWSGTDNLINQDGVVAWQSSTSTYAAVYDHSQQSWKYDYWSGVDALSVSNGTVFFSSSATNYKKGYSISSHSWQDNYNTALSCRLFVTENSGTDQLITYFWNLTIGASSYSYNCGDGHTITGRWAWKQYNNPGSYSAVLSIFNSNSNNTCSQGITVNDSHVGIIETTDNSLQISPNPASDWLIVEPDASKDFQTVEIINLMGQVITSRQFTHSDKIKLDVSTLSPGAYFVRMTSAESRSIRKVIVE